MQGGVGMDEGVAGFVALAVALGLPGADRAAALEAGDDAFGDQLAEVIGVEGSGSRRGRVRSAGRRPRPCADQLSHRSRPSDPSAA